jgi:hypothetical protein
MRLFVCLFVLQYDGAVADFPDRPPTAGAGGSRWGGFSSYSEWKWHVLNKPNMDMLRNHQHKGVYRAASAGKSTAGAEAVLAEAPLFW